MSNSGINFKVYLVDGENSEVKRFFVDHDIVTSYVFMEEKFKSVFPSLRNCDFKISWKDADGDLISISNDEDFITALTEMNYNPKVLYINTSSKNSSETAAQFRVICDICQNGITGYRYKCIECPNYDLCATCENSGNHSEHMVLRLPNTNASTVKLDRKMMYNVCRALKKSVGHANKCARDSFKTGGEKEKQSRNDDAGTSGQTGPSFGCPLAGADMNQLLTENISPFIEMLSKAAPSPSNNGQKPPNTLSDLIHSVMEAFTGSVITDPTSANNEQSNSKQSNNEEPTKQQNVSEKQEEGQNMRTQPSAPNNPQEMEWTIVGDNDDSTNQNSRLRTAPSQPPQPPQDPRLMRGLAQLHEMGFSNENNFLNYLLELHEYNVSNVVKAIIELK